MRNPHVYLVLTCIAWLAGSCIVRSPAPLEVSSMKGAEAAEQASVLAHDGEPGAAAGVGTISVRAGTRFQTLEGFGAATAWYMDRITGVTPDDLYEFLFPELGIDIIRFRNRFERGGDEDTRLAEEVEIFQRATEALGHKPRLLLSAWSPPGTLKASGKERCASEPDCTLKKVNGRFSYDEYADWWIRSLKHYHELGLTPDYVSMQNEPNFIPPDWEGCKFAPTETNEFPGYGEALARIHRRLGELSFKPKILGPETLGVHYQQTEKYLAGLNESHLYGVAHHLYEKGSDGVWDWRTPGPDSYLDRMQGVRAATALPIFQTEFNTDDDQGTDGGLETAWLIHHTMTGEGAVAFLYWDLIWPSKGLVSMRGRTPSPRDQYYSLKHFARYTDPGDRRVDAVSDTPGLLASAYLAADETRVTIVLLNTTDRVLDAGLSLQDFAAKSSAVFQTVFRPGKSKRWAAMGSLPPGELTRMPARSVVTIVIQR